MLPINRMLGQIAVAASAVVLLPSAAQAIWYGTNGAYDSLDVCLKHHNKCYWGGTLVERTGQLKPVVARPDRATSAQMAKSTIKIPPPGRPLPTDGDIFYYTTVKPDPSSKDAPIWKHMCLLKSSVTDGPCSGGQLDIWVKI